MAVQRMTRTLLILGILGIGAAAHAAGTMEDLKSTDLSQFEPQLQTLRIDLKDSPAPAPAGGGVILRHETNPPTHQWILFQAAAIWSKPELAARLPAAWTDSLGDLDKAPLTYGVRMEDDELDMKHFALCGGHPYCNHFWDPTKGDDAGLYFLQQWDSAVVRAQKLWDGQVLPLYKAGKKDEAYFWLGRVAHMLGDLSVPAHTHRDIHPFWESFEKYMVERGPGGYNFKQWTGSGGPVEASSLHELFFSMASLANEYDSAHVAGSLPENYVGHNGATEKQGSTVEHYNVSYAECRRQGEVLMPAVYRHTAGLYKLFWKQTHPSAAE